ncbi:MAG: TetR/AcrR family transcriptional regulator [Rhodospirillales bacterium]
MAKAATAIKLQNPDALSEKVQAILHAGARVFLQSGYGSASMDAIATEANVSKQTVYSHFGAKDALFEAIIENKCAELLRPAFESLAPTKDPASNLKAVASRFIAVILASSSTALFRVIVAESGRFPELAEAFYRAGPETAVKNLAGYLKELDNAGALSIEDATASAQQFFALLRGDLYMRRLLDLTPEPTDKEIKAVVDQAVSAFMIIHAPK